MNPLDQPFIIANGVKLPVVTIDWIPPLDPIFRSTKYLQENRGGRPRTRTGTKAEKDWQDYKNKEGQWRRKK